MRPYRGSGIDIFASTGPVGQAGSEFWGSSQAVLAIAIWADDRPRPAFSRKLQPAAAPRRGEGQRSIRNGPSSRRCTSTITTCSRRSGTRSRWRSWRELGVPADRLAWLAASAFRSASRRRRGRSPERHRCGPGRPLSRRLAYPSCSGFARADRDGARQPLRKRSTTVLAQRVELGGRHRLAEAERAPLRNAQHEVQELFRGDHRVVERRACPRALRARERRRSARSLPASRLRSSPRRRASESAPTRRR